MHYRRQCSSSVGLSHDFCSDVPKFAGLCCIANRARIHCCMTLPELRFMCDSTEKVRCMREAKRRVLSLMTKRQRSLLFVGYFFVMGTLSTHPFPEGLAIGGAICIGGELVYWRLYRRRLRGCLREVIQQTTECCPACGYNVKGDTGDRCPECGRDKEKVPG